MSSQTHSSCYSYTFYSLIQVQNQFSKKYIRITNIGMLMHIKVMQTKFKNIDPVFFIEEFIASWIIFVCLDCYSFYDL